MTRIARMGTGAGIREIRVIRGQCLVSALCPLSLLWPITSWWPQEAQESQNPNAGRKDVPEAPQQASLVSSDQFVLPDSQYLPSLPAEGSVDEPVAGLVGRNLLPPERRVAPRPDEVPGAPVPEAIKRQ
jgi:hypothetical protein